MHTSSRAKFSMHTLDTKLTGDANAYKIEATAQDAVLSQMPADMYLGCALTTQTHTMLVEKHH